MLHPSRIPLHVTDDVRENLADHRTEDSQDHNHHNGNQHQDQGVLDQPLPFCFVVTRGTLCSRLADPSMPYMDGRPLKIWLSRLEWRVSAEVGCCFHCPRFGPASRASPPRRLAHSRCIGTWTLEVAQRLTVSKGTIARWSALYSWVARAEAWDDEQDRLKRLSQIKAIEAMAERHAQQAQAIATVPMHWWKSKTIPHHWQPKSFE